MAPGREQDRKLDPFCVYVFSLCGATLLVLYSSGKPSRALPSRDEEKIAAKKSSFLLVLCEKRFTVVEAQPTGMVWIAMEP